MTDQTQNQIPPQENKPSDKEINFRALQAKYEKQLEQERQARLEAEKKAQEYAQRQSKIEEDDEDDSEPYVDNKRLNKRLAKSAQNTQSEIQKAMEIAKQEAKVELKREMWMKNNPDFYDILQHAEKIIQKDPELAETILEMPEGFERQKLVYKSIKAMGLDKPEMKQPSIQEKVDANRRSPYYQPSGVGTAPYSSVGDYSPSGQKQAYEKMKELKNRLRLG